MAVKFIGTDEIKIDGLGTPDDTTDLNASTGAHGLSPKLSGNATDFYNGVGGFSVPAGTGDAAAIHDDVSNEIHSITAKAVPIGADEIVIEDSAASWAKKRVAISTLPTGSASPLTTKGDLYTYDTDDARLPAGTVDGDVLTIDSGEATGLKWAPVGVPSLVEESYETLGTEDPGDPVSFALTATPGGKGAADTPSGYHLLVYRNGQKMAYAASPATYMEYFYDSVNNEVDVLASGDADPYEVVMVEVTSVTDSTAIHDDVPSEIHAIASKGVPVGADEILLEDSADSWNKKRAALSTLTATDTNAIHKSTSGEIHAITSKSSPTTSDEILIEDAAASYSKKRATLANLPTGVGSPLTIKGDIYTRSSSAASRLAIGSNGTVLTADSTQTTGQKWNKPVGFVTSTVYLASDQVIVQPASSGLVSIPNTPITMSFSGTAGEVTILTFNATSSTDQGTSSQTYFRMKLNGAFVGPQVREHVDTVNRGGFVSATFAFALLTTGSQSLELCAGQLYGNFSILASGSGSFLQVIQWEMV